MNVKTMVYLMSEDVTDDSGSMHQFSLQMPSGSVGRCGWKIECPERSEGNQLRRLE